MNAHASTDFARQPMVAEDRKLELNHRLKHLIQKRRRKRGFTIVEMLTVVGIIALLMAIAVPALRGVQTRTRKTVEANSIRHVYLAWTMYGNHNRDAATPGYLAPDVQKAWRVKYEYPLPANAGNPNEREIPASIAAPWTWRLFHYFDHNLETTWRYRNAPSLSWPALVAMAKGGGLGGDGFNSVDDLMAAVAEEPAFGYNAYHVGGWWEMQPMPGAKGAGDVALPKFFDAKSVTNGAPVEVVSRSIASIRRPADLIVFCTSTKFLDAGTHRVRDDNLPGSHVVMPPFLGNQARWVSPPSSNAAYTNMVQTLVADTDAPLGRYNSMPTLIHADGSIESTLPVTLFDMRRWIDNPLRTDEPYLEWFTN